MSDKPSRGALLSVYLTVFLDLLGFGIILPFLPYQALELGVDVGGFEVGLLLTAYSLAQLFGAAFLGRLSDRFGRRPVLLLSLAGASLAMVLSGLAPTLALLIAARAVAGLFAGSVATAQAYVADVTTPEERAKYMGFVGASIGLGFVLGPSIGGVFALLGLQFHHAAFAAAGLGVVNLLLAARYVKEPTRTIRRGRLRAQDWLEALGRRNVWPVLLAMFCTMLAFVGMETTFALLGKELYGLGPRGFSGVLAFVGVIMVIVQGGLIGRLTKLFEIRSVAMAGGVAMAASLALLPFCPTLPFAFAVMAVLGLGQGLISPTLPTLLSKASDADMQGSVLGIGRSLGAAARAAGPLAAGWIYDQHIAGPYLVGGGLALVAGLVLTRTTIRSVPRPASPREDET